MSRNRITGDALTTAALNALAGTTKNEGLVDDILIVPSAWAAGAHTLNLNGSISGQIRPADGDQLDVQDPFGKLSPAAPLTINTKIGALGFQVADSGALVNQIVLSAPGDTRQFTFSSASNCWIAVGKPLPLTPPAASFTYADFFALMPGDNAATVAVGAAVQFPQNGPTSGTIVRGSASTFTLPVTGKYKVDFQVSFDEPGQLALAIGGVILPNTVVGRATGTNQAYGSSIITANAGDVLSVINPAGNAAALTITPIAGGTHSVSAHLVIQLFT